MVIMNIHVILKHLQLVMNLLLTFSIPLVHNKWHITQVNFITKKKSIGGITSFVLDPGYLLPLTGMQRNLSPECLL